MSTRSVSIDICKGLGMLFVLIGHQQNTLGIGTIFYLFHMGLFFILSGACLSDKYCSDISGVRSFVFKRFKSLLLPYVLIRVLASIGRHLSPDFGEYISNYHILGTIWFLPSLFFASIVSVFLLYVQSKTYRMSSYAWGVILLLTVHIVDYCLGTTITIDGVRLSAWIYYAFFFYSGFMIKRYIWNVVTDKDSSEMRIILFMIILALLVVLKSVMPKTISLCDYHSFIPYTITTLLGTYLTMRVAIYLESSQKWSNFFLLIGNHSLSIMLFHWVAFSSVDILNNSLVQIPSEFLVFVAKTLLGISIPILLSTLYQKLKNISINK